MKTVGLLGINFYQEYLSPYKGYTELLSESRDEAIERMKKQAKKLGANAVLNVRFSTSLVSAGESELYLLAWIHCRLVD